MFTKARTATVLLAFLGGSALAQSAQSTPLISEGEERLWVMRWRLTASRENLNRQFQYFPPRHRTQPFAIPPTGFVGNRPVQHGIIQSIDVRSAIFVAPVQWRTASSEAFPQYLEGSFDFNSGTVTQEWIGQPGDLPDVINVEWFVRVASDDGKSLVPIINQPERIDIDFRLPVRVHETVFNESAAMDIDWPAAWPKWTQALRDPQPHIDSNDRFVGSLLNRWTNNAPHSLPPARLAKLLASNVIEHAQPGTSSRAYWPEPDSVRGYPFAATRGQFPFLRGFDVQEGRLHRNNTIYRPRIRQAIEDAQASAAIITNLYVALLRAADIPARTIVAILPPEAELERVPGRDTRPAIGEERLTRFRFWAEFYLWDEQAQRGEWIPVDVVRQREESSRPPPLDRAWRYFGNHDELDEVVPMTSVFTPSSAAPLGWVPSVWGWKPDPSPAGFDLDPILDFEVMSAPRRANDPFGEIGVNRGR